MPANTDLLRLKTNLTVFNRMLMHMEIEENGVTLPAFSKTNIKPDWIHFYRFTPQQIEFLMIKTILRLNDEPDDIQSIKAFAESISEDPETFFKKLDDEELNKQEEANFLEKFNQLDEKEQTKKIEDQMLLFHLIMALSYNYISVMMHSLTIKDLLIDKPKPTHRDIYDSVKVDKCLIFHEKVQKEIAKQQLDGNEVFFQSLSRSLSHTKFKCDRKVPRVYYAFSILEYDGYITEGKANPKKCTADELLDIIKDAGFYLPKSPTNNINKFREQLKKWHLDKKRRKNNPSNQINLGEFQVNQ